MIQEKQFKSNHIYQNVNNVIFSYSKSNTLFSQIFQGILS